ncbi:winged helix DNA-binding domain-containing protein [Nakamurella sp.]|uniref:winged helix DNA-binding domain-containing protein n=1 Tax=Nakamurella sp. TaxID=1869182 RepID=UPI003B3A0C15
MPTDEEILRARMYRQGVWGGAAPDAPAVLSGLGAMQGQEFAYALWALAQRVRPDARPGHADLLAAFDRGDILRTHVLRPTWHLVRPADVRAMLRATAPRVRLTMTAWDRQLGLDRPTLDRAQQILAAQVAGGRHRTRRDLAAALEAAGIPAAGQRLTHLVTHAEFDEVLISGAMAGKQQTYAAFDERVPPADPGPDPGTGPAPGAGTGTDPRNPPPADPPADPGLVALAARYAATRAPMTAKDFAGWASLTITRARAALEAAGCRPEPRAGMTLYGPPAGTPDPPATAPDGPRADLLQGYDELIMSYSESRSVIVPDGSSLPVLSQEHYLHAVLIDGVLAGHWRHRLATRTAQVQVEPIRAWSAAERRAVQVAVDEYGRYLDRPVTTDWTPRA